MKQFLFIIYFFIYVLSYSQSCDYNPSKKAEKYFFQASVELKKNNYKKTLKFAEKSVKEDENYAEALNLAGWMYYKQKNKSLAFWFFEEQVKLCEKLDSRVLVLLGEWFSSKDINKAIGFYDLYLKYSDLDLIEKQAINYKKTHLIVIDSLFSNPVSFNPILVDSISTKEDEYLACISPDGTLAFYTRSFMKKTKDMLYPLHIEEFTVSINYGNFFDKGKRASSPFNQEYNEGAPSITADNRTLYLSICEGNKNCDIYVTQFQNGYWSNITRLSPVINGSESWESQPSITSDGNKLYFSSNRLGGYGGLDIYSSIREEGGIWSEPKNLGPQINTNQDEKSPFIHSDSQTLYFSSNGHYSLGGYDIFYSEKIDTSWLQPKNIGFPINSKDDDLGLFVQREGKKAFFSSNILKGNGGWDLYEFDLYAAAQPKAVVMIKGIVLTKDSLPPTNTLIKTTNLSTNQKFQFNVQEDNGEYTLIIPKRPSENILLTIEKSGYAFQSHYIDNMNEVLRINWHIDSLVRGSDYRLNDIRFLSNSYELNQSAKKVVQAFSEYLHKNDSLQIAIHGHTDNIGNDVENQILSTKRAEIVYKELIKCGVDFSRLDFRGFGESYPIANNLTENGRSLNRRTVFQIISF